MYFSFVVLTTLGFGDLTPATDGGKAMVAFEALLGQLFLVTVVSRLVSLYTGTKRSIQAAAELRATAGPAGAAGASDGQRVRSVTPSSSPTAARPAARTRWRARAEPARTSCTP